MLDVAHCGMVVGFSLRWKKNIKKKYKNGMCSVKVY
jgi:hypothetical protein